MTQHTPTADIIRETAQLVAASQGRDAEVFRRLIQRASDAPLIHLGAALLLLAHHPDPDPDPDNAGAGLIAATKSAIGALAATGADGER